jgi:outer membrane murein-binding lipoprotein Lpp
MKTPIVVALIAILGTLVVSGCGDRERINCPRTKNKAPRASVIEEPTTTTTLDPLGRCS